MQLRLHYWIYMEAIDEIKQWLEAEEKDFAAGYNLFVRFSHNRALALYLARKNDMAKLTYEIEKIAQRPVLKEMPVMPIAPIVKQIAVKSDAVTVVEASIDQTEKKIRVIKGGQVQYDELPEEFKKLYDENLVSYKNMRTLHEQMKLAKTDDERAAKRKMIDSFDDLIARNWKRIDDWAEGKLEAKEVTKQSNTADVLKKIQAARTYLSRNIDKMANLEGEAAWKLKYTLREKLSFIRDNKAEISKETLEKLAKHGIIDETDLG